MYNVTIDPKRCAGEGLCVAVCSAGVFVQDQPGVPNVASSLLCNRCGHCVAICPKDAISHSAFSPADFPRRPRSKRITPEDLTLFLRARRSVREWQDKPVPHALLEQLVDVGRYAPTGSNLQNVGFVVVEDRELIRALDYKVVEHFKPLLAPERNPNGLTGSLGRLGLRLAGHEAGERNCVLHDAPALVVLHAPAEYALGEENCHYAALHMILLAEAHGLGSCFMGWLINASRKDEEIKALLHVPSDRRVGTAFTLGYPRYRYSRLVPRDPATITWL